MSKDAKTLVDIMVQIQTRDALPIPMKACSSLFRIYQAYLIRQEQIITV